MEHQPAGRTKRVRKPTERAQESAAQAAAEVEQYSAKRRRSASPAVTAVLPTNAPARLPLFKSKTSGSNSVPAGPRAVPYAELQERLHKVQQTLEELKSRQKLLPHLHAEAARPIVNTSSVPGKLEEQPDSSRPTLTSIQAPNSTAQSPSPGTPAMDTEAGLRGTNSDSSSDYNTSAPSGPTRVESAAAMAMAALKGAPAPLPVAKRSRRKPLTVKRAPSM